MVRPAVKEMMRTSVPGIFKRRQSGFTLLELLVTLVVMSIAISMVMLNILPDERAQLRDESERLALMLENAGLEARISGRPLAWSSSQTGYQFWRKNDYNDWVRIAEADSFRSHNLPVGMTIGEVRVEEQPLKRDDLLSFSPSVLPQPYDIRMNYVSTSLYLVGKSSGEIAIQNTLPLSTSNQNAHP
jgi:general secretion pathway protein H